ncbi:MAG: MMPL family transporter [Fuerstiella sp.]|nr:MMPL family transporter [Fuerstiella sp.]
MIHWPEQMPRKDVWAVIRDCEQLIVQQPLLGQPLSIRTALTVIRGPNRRDQSVLANRLPDDLKAQFYRPDLRLALVATRTQDLGIATFGPIFERMESQLRQMESDNPGVEVKFVSDVIIEGRVVSQMIDELMSSLMMAAVVIFGVLAIAFRSLRVGLISIVPNLMPLAVSGTMRLMLGDSLGIAGACSFAICLGIAVDDTIHYLCHFKHERRLGSSPLVANQRTFITVGSALMLTTVVMTAGLGTVMTSQLPPHVNFAIMACTTLAVALPADLLFLPALLTLFPGKLPDEAEPQSNYSD